MINRDEFKVALAVIYTLQILIITFLSFKSPFIALNVNTFIITQTIINFLFAFYLLNLKNIVGWWKREWFLAKARREHKESIKMEYEKRVGYNYEQLKG